MRRDIAYVLAIVVVALTVRVYAPWHAVFDDDRINFLETDAWYHVRLIENQVRNWPWRVTLDPYAAPGGQFVPIAPLFDTLTATVVLGVYGRDAETRQVERVAALVPPVLGTFTVIVVWALGRCVFDRWAGLLGAALLAILPGHFLDRTLLGFYDHHALEALLAMTTWWALAKAQRSTVVDTGGVVSGLVLGLYLLGWSSGAFLLGILGLWLLLLIPIAREPDLSRTAGVLGTAALVAFILVVVFQDRRMHRYDSQIIGLVGLGGMSIAVRIVGGRCAAAARTALVYGSIVLVGAMGAAMVWWLEPGLVRQLTIDLARLAPDPARMAVLEARPLFLYSGSWRWQQPWEFFRTGFFVGLLALVAFTPRIWRERRPIDLALWLFALATFAATIGQNRFGYYLVPACAVLGGWLASRILDWGGMPCSDQSTQLGRPVAPLQRELAILTVAAGMFVPNLVPAVLTAPRAGSLPRYWHDAMTWLGSRTPDPFLHGPDAGEYYFARYPRDSVPPPEYSVMNWWDHGYWIIQVGRRVPVANPTQERAPNAARFYASTDERAATALLEAERARYVLVDWEMPFRPAANGTVMGRFQSVLDWAGAEHRRYYEVYYRRAREDWSPVWVFHEAYYRSMAYRLMVLAGAPAAPANSTSVVVVVDRRDTTGREFREILSQTTYATYEAARLGARMTHAAGTAVIVGLDPWQPAFPLEPLTFVQPVHESRTPEQQPSEAPWVRVFEVR